jgi:hypothetical protein
MITARLIGCLSARLNQYGAVVEKDAEETISLRTALIAP